MLLAFRLRLTHSVCGFNYRKTESHKNFLHLSSLASFHDAKCGYTKSYIEIKLMMLFSSFFPRDQKKNESVALYESDVMGMKVGNYYRRINIKFMISLQF